jgi:hypothetical protein
MESIGFHDFENAPLGVVPHTTAPTDFCSPPHRGFPSCWITVFMPFSPRAAGAFLSPLLGMTLVAFSGGGTQVDLANRNGSRDRSLSPIPPMLPARRPDHQSLVILLVGAGLAAEIALWKRPSRAWEICSAVLWRRCFDVIL